MGRKVANEYIKYTYELTVTGKERDLGLLSIVP